MSETINEAAEIENLRRCFEENRRKLMDDLFDSILKLGICETIRLDDFRTPTADGLERHRAAVSRALNNLASYILQHYAPRRNSAFEVAIGDQLRVTITTSRKDEQP